MITEKELTEEQRTYFMVESEERKANILHALSRKPVVCKCRSEARIIASYVYKRGRLKLVALYSFDRHLSGNGFSWSGATDSVAPQKTLDGYETDEQITDIILNMMYSDICAKGAKALKQILL